MRWWPCASPADRARGEPVLDLGVGGGRTTSLLRLLHDDYIENRVTPELVPRCAGNDTQEEGIRLGDARSLVGIDSGSKGLVTFSNNGIDAVDRKEPRQGALRGGSGPGAGWHVLLLRP